jgi:hypothetical protein
VPKKSAETGGNLIFSFRYKDFFVTINTLWHLEAHPFHEVAYPFREVAYSSYAILSRCSLASE